MAPMAAAAADPQAPTPAPAAMLNIAQARLGDLAIGIDTRFVVHAIVRPAGLTRLPRSHDAIDGVFADGEDVVPVVDLRRWMGEHAVDGAAPGHVMILRAHGRTIGLAIDEACGVARVPAARVRRVHRADAEDGFFHSVAQVEDGVLLSLLDPERLMDRVQAWTDGLGGVDGADGARDAATQAAGASARLHALLRLGDETLAVPADQVVEVLNRPAHQPLLARDPQLLGMIDWRRNPVPLVDVSGALGMAPGRAPLAMVVARGRAQVALLIDAVVDVRPLDASGVAAADAAADSPVLFRGQIVVDDGQRVLLLDSDALLDSFAAPGLVDTRDAHTEARQAAASEAYAVFRTGQAWAIPMGVLEEILRQPASAIDTRARGSALAPTFAWRERTLPLVDLREPSAAAAGAKSAQACVMIARRALGHVALVVDDVVEMLFVQKSDVLGFQAPGGKRTRMVSVTQDGKRVSYPLVDVEGLDV